VNLVRLVAVCLADAVRALGLLAGGVGPDGRALNDGSCVYGQDTVGYRSGKAVHPTGGRAAPLLAYLVVLRTVAGALEPLR